MPLKIHGRLAGEDNLDRSWSANEEIETLFVAPVKSSNISGQKASFAEKVPLKNHILVKHPEISMLIIQPFQEFSVVFTLPSGTNSGV